MITKGAKDTGGTVRDLLVKVSQRSSECQELLDELDVLLFKPASEVDADVAKQTARNIAPVFRALATLNCEMKAFMKTKKPAQASSEPK